MTDKSRICVARIGAAHGIRGEIRLWPFTADPLAVLNYGALETQDGTRDIEIAAARVVKDHLVARLKGVATREDAERLTGLELYVPRARLPATAEGEFYHADLIGLSAKTRDDRDIGRVVAVHNFGAGDILEIAPSDGGGTMLLPFTNAVVPQVDVAQGMLIVDPPAEIEDDAPDEDG